MFSIVVAPVYNLTNSALGFPFHFTAGFFSLAEAFYLMKSYLFILSFMFLALGDISVKLLLRGMSEIFLPVFLYDFYGVTTYI